MTRPRVVVALIAGIAVGACGKSERSSNRNVAADEHPDKGSATPYVDVDELPQAAPKDDAQPDVQAWFAQYRAAHADATPANAVDTGKKMWELLSKDSQTFVAEQAKTAVMAASKPIMPDPQEIAYKIIGETAAARAALMRDAKLAGVTPDGVVTISGHKVWKTKVVVASGVTKLALALVSDGGTWKLDPTPDLLVREDELFKAPSTGSDAPHGLPSIDAVAAAWKKTVDSGNGWDALNIMSPAMRKQLLDMVGRMGGNGMPDVARVMEKTLVDRRNRGLTVKAVTIEDRTDTRASLKMTYSNDESDTFTAVRLDGSWWLELKI